MKNPTLVLLFVISSAARIYWPSVRITKVYPLGFGRFVSPDVSQRIVGGFKAHSSQFPYQVGLLSDVHGNLSWCGGALISNQSVLTAAHCIDQAATTIVFLGSTELQKYEPLRQVILVDKSQFHIHSGWNGKTLENDIALIRLPQEIQLERGLGIIALPNSTQAKYDFIGHTTIVSGWGRTSGSSVSVSQALRYVDLKIIPETECKRYFGDFVRSTNICTSGAESKTTCKGDSGGPLVYSDHGVSILIGVSSYGSSSGCEKGYPAVFTRVSSYLQWIETFIK